jgi:hypothetical protein
VGVPHCKCINIPIGSIAVGYAREYIRERAKAPAALNVDIDEEGRTVGLF